MNKKNCLTCKKEFTIKFKSLMKRKFCSSECSLRSMHKTNVKKRNVLECQFCRNYFTTDPHLEKERKYCSVVCTNKGLASKGLRSGSNNGHWKSGKSENEGYSRITFGRDSMKYEHRKIVENSLNRKLSSIEIVHHINGDKKDNRIENLQVVSRAEHMNIHRGEIMAGFKKETS